MSQPKIKTHTIENGLWYTIEKRIKRGTSSKKTYLCIDVFELALRWSTSAEKMPQVEDFKVLLVGIFGKGAKTSTLYYRVRIHNVAEAKQKMLMFRLKYGL